jgi:Ca-activated chloride channel family protein
MMSTWLANQWVLWLLLATPLLSLLAWYGRRRARQRLLQLGTAPALLHLREGGRQWDGWRRLLLGMGLVLVLVGIAGPQWGRDPGAVATQGRDLVVVVDVSRSMLADDVPPSRLEATRRALVDLADTVQQRGGHRLGLVAFAAGAQVLCPLTQDFDHFRQKLAELDPEALPRLRPGEKGPSGTRMGAGLREAILTLDERFRQGQAVLMISDGDDPADDGEWRRGISSARGAGVPVHTVGVGNPDRDTVLPVKFEGQPAFSRLHEEPLETIARQTGGTYTPSRTGELRLGQLFREQIEPGPGRDVRDENVPVYRQRYAGFLAAGLGFLALALVLGPYTRRRKATNKESTPMNNKSRPSQSSPLVPASSAIVSALALLLLSAAPALDPLEAVRLGNAAYERGDYAAAVKLYEQAELRTTDPGLVAYNKAAALFRLAEVAPDPALQQVLFRAAELHYRSSIDQDDPQRRTRALYDLGTCLLRQSLGQDRKLLDAAIEAFRRCLNESHDASLKADAQHNLELAKLLRLKAAPVPAKDEPKPPERNGSSSTGNDPGTEPKNGHNTTQPTVGLNGQDVKPVKPPKGGLAPIQVDQTQPGQGDLPPIPDTAELVPMPPQDAAAHLQQAAQRILRERRAHLKQQTPPPGPGVKDW